MRQDAEGFEDVDDYFALTTSPVANVPTTPIINDENISPDQDAPKRKSRGRPRKASPPSKVVSPDNKTKNHDPKHLNADSLLKTPFPETPHNRQFIQTENSSIRSVRSIKPEKSTSTPKSHPEKLVVTGLSESVIDSQISAMFESSLDCSEYVDYNVDDSVPFQYQPSDDKLDTTEPVTNLKLSKSKKQTLKGQKSIRDTRLPPIGPRKRISPLKFWKGERIVRKRRLSSPSAPVVVEIIRSKEPDITESPRKKKQICRKKTRVESTLETKSVNKEQVRNELLRLNGFVPGVEFTGRAVNYDTNREEDRLIACGPEHTNPQLVEGEGFSIHTIFTEGGYISAGILSFPPGSNKPPRNSSKHALVFHVMQGSFKVTVHKETFVVGAGAHFIVPRGNQYALQSTWDDGASQLFFCHCRDSSQDLD